jgi:hypothetical protein
MAVHLNPSLWMNTMNRCLPNPTALFLKTLPLAFASALALSASPCAAQMMQRQLPPTAQRGVLEVTSPPDILINGSAERLSPGARIKASNNLLVLSATLVGQSLLVNYVRDPQGLVHEVWILTADEAQQAPNRVPQ